MREWFKGLFNKNLGGLEISLFDGWHIGYIILTILVPIIMILIFQNKSERAKKIVINTFLIAATVSYVLDFFVMAFYLNEIDIDKLPFHICTIMSIVACFARFNGHFKWLNTSAVVICVVSPLMYITYPGTALGVSLLLATR